MKGEKFQRTLEIATGDVDVVGDRLHQRALGALVKFRAWLVGAVYTAGSMAVVHDGDGYVLLVKPWYRQGWGLPGGMMKWGEQSTDTLRREIHEEIGVDLGVVERVDVYVQHARRHIDHLYLIELPAATELTTGRIGEISDVDWFALEELPSLQPEAAEALDRLARH